MGRVLLDWAGGRRSRIALAGVASLTVPGAVLAQDQTGDAPAPVAAQEAGTAGRTIYLPADFARFAPKNARDMLANVPGFAINNFNQGPGRGLGEADTNVLIDGRRLVLKSETVASRLDKISADRVARIEIVEGATMGIPGLSGPVANIVTSGGGLSGQFQWQTRFRPGYIKPEWFGGNASLTGTSGGLEYLVSVSNDYQRDTFRGPVEITDGDGELIEVRDAYFVKAAEKPKIAGSLKWDTPGGTVANVNASYRRVYMNATSEEQRDAVFGIDSEVDYDPRERGYEYELGGDVEFGLAGGRLKLIGLERYTRTRYGEDFVLTPLDGSDAEGSRYINRSESGERIGRAEYGWAMLGGDWQIAAEAAFNRYRGAAQLFELDPDGAFVEVPFPFGTGGVTEDRYEAVLTHGRQLASNLSLQVGAGAEYSKLVQTGPQDVARSFQRPKGSIALGWAPGAGLDLSLKFSRVVGQLSFGDFLSRVDLNQGTGSAGNVSLVPPQSWEADLDVKKDLGAWGSSSLRLTARWYQDYIDWIVLPGELPGTLIEARGNVDRARAYELEWNTTLNLDPLGWKGAKLEVVLDRQFTAIRDPLTGENRAFSGLFHRTGHLSVRHDIPGTDWAWSASIEPYIVRPDYRLSERVRDQEGRLYTFAYVEHKDVFGLTVRAEVFYISGDTRYLDRTVYDGYRGSSPVLFTERARQPVGRIYTVTVKGTF